MNSAVTIVVCTYNRPATLERCLRSIRLLEFEPRRTVVVDNAPAGCRVSDLAREFDAEYRQAPIRGLSRARNIGSIPLDAEFVAYIDDDMVVSPNWLSSLIDEFSDSSVVGVTGPILPMKLAGEFIAILAEEVRHRPWGSTKFKVERTNRDWFERANFGGIGDGNFALRSSVFNWWKGFDERIGRGRPIGIGEEHFAFFEMIERGNAIVYCPNAIAFHPEDSSATFSIAQDLAYSAFVGIQYPKYIPRLCKYLIEGSSGMRRSWRRWNGHPLRRPVPASELARAIVSAVSTLWRAYHAD